MDVEFLKRRSAVRLHNDGSPAMFRKCDYEQTNRSPRQARRPTKQLNSLQRGSDNITPTPHENDKLSNSKPFTTTATGLSPLSQRSDLSAEVQSLRGESQYPFSNKTSKTIDAPSRYVTTQSMSTNTTITTSTVTTSNTAYPAFQKLLKVNRSGKSFVLDKASLIPYPETRLGAMALLHHDDAVKLADLYLETSNEYYFERSPLIFDFTVLSFYASAKGSIHVPNVCPDEFIAEIVFWRFSAKRMASCCVGQIPDYLLNSPMSPGAKSAVKAHGAFFGRNKNQETGAMVTKTVSFREGALNKHTPMRRTLRRDPFQDSYFAGARRMLWKVLAKPWDSLASKLFSCIALFFILLVAVVFTLTSFRDFQAPTLKTDPTIRPELSTPRQFYSSEFEVIPTITRTINNSYELNQSLPKRYSTIKPENYHTQPHRCSRKRGPLRKKSTRYDDRKAAATTLETLYVICGTWLLFEYVLRLFAAPKRLEHFKAGLTIIDTVCLIAFLINFVLYTGINQRWCCSRHLVRVFGMIQVFQIFRIARYASDVRFLGIAISKSLNEIGVVIVISGLMTMLFAVIIFSIEQFSEKTSVTNIPIAMYWVVITMTTVGYGDVNVLSPWGRGVAILAAFTGVIILGFPISLAISQFSDVYEHEMDRKRRKNKRRLQQQQQQLDPLDSFRSKSRRFIGLRPGFVSGSVRESEYYRDAPVDERRRRFSANTSIRKPPSYHVKRRQSHVAGAMGRNIFIIRRQHQSDTDDTSDEDVRLANSIREPQILPLQDRRKQSAWALSQLQAKQNIPGEFGSLKNRSSVDRESTISDIKDFEGYSSCRF